MSVEVRVRCVEDVYDGRKHRESRLLREGLRVDF